MYLTIWTITHQTDSDCYSIRSKTKEHALATLRERGVEDYTIPEYSDEGAGCIELSCTKYHFRDAFDIADSFQGEDPGRRNIRSKIVWFLDEIKFES